MNNEIVLINFIDLTENEKEMVLNWRNNEDIKKWMYTQDDITINEHLNFINNLVGNISKQYFVVKSNDEYIGVVDFTDISKDETYFGLYSNPESKVTGVGRLLEEICLDYAFKTLKVKKLKLEVFSENIRVRNLHKKYKFKETSTKIVNGKEVTCMELNNENR